MLDAALALNDRGFSVFPCAPKGKKPLTAHGLKDASRDRAQLSTWWKKTPEANPAIAIDAGVVVIDVDGPSGAASLAALEREHGALPVTLEGKTGRGRHLWFRIPAGMVARNRTAIATGLDVRTVGGYVIAPGSIHANGTRYEWVNGDAPIADAPEWLLETADIHGPESEPARAAKPAPLRVVREGDAPAAFGDRALAVFRFELDRVRSAAHGTRNDTLNRAAYTAGGLVAGGGLEEALARTALLDAALATGLDVREADGVIERGMESGRRRPLDVAVGCLETIPPATVTGAVDIIRHDICGVMAGQVVWFNDMVGSVMVGDNEIADHMVTAFRCDVETRILVPGKEGKPPKGLRITKNDAYDAFGCAAQLQRRHPVAEFLLGLSWDGVPRIDSLHALLGASDARIVRVMLRRWMISLVARPLNPGEKVDTVLVLVGAQGTGKSSFFKILASPEWFNDSPVDIRSKDAYATLRRAWINEWAELESMLRARDSDAVKAFLSSSEDVYRPAYARTDSRAPRSGVIVATTNRDSFLSDESGGRRFWPVKTGEIDLAGVRVQREQLLAEAVAAYKAGESWWLERDEDAELADLQRDYEAGDAWEDRVLSYASTHFVFSTADVLGEGGVGKPQGQWTRADEMRVSRILTLAGYVKAGRDRPRRWVKEGR